MTNYIIWGVLALLLGAILHEMMRDHKWPPPGGRFPNL